MCVSISSFDLVTFSIYSRASIGAMDETVLDY